MRDTEFIETLKRKRESHLREIERQKRLINSIDNLMKAYSNGDHGITESELPLNTELPRMEINYPNLNLTDAIYYAMLTNPSKEWRGAEIKRFLESKGFKSNNLGQKISGRLSSRAKSPKSKWAKPDGENGIPRYILKPEFRNTSINK